MSHQKLEQILKHGIHGSPELLPEERKLFLSTISERVYLALTNSQVRQRGTYDEADQVMKQQKDARLLINGTLNYAAYNDYIQTANKHTIPFTIVNDGHSSPFGIVLASETAVNNEENMFIEDNLFESDMP